MKKITLLLMFFYSLIGYSQLENFDSCVFPPAGWAVTNGTNNIGAGEQWHLNSVDTSYPGHSGSCAAFVNRENVGNGNTEEDWLIMNQRLVPADGQLRFWTRQTSSGNQFTVYQIRVSTNADQMNKGAYTVMKQWDEAELTDLNGDITQYESKAVDFLPAYIGQQVYVAFVRVFAQTGPGIGGDRWLVDDVNIVQKCNSPIGLDAPIATVTSTTAKLLWTNLSVSNNFEIELLYSSDNPTGVANFTGSGTTYTATGLDPGTCYQFFVRSVCTDSPSEWAGPFIFCTLPLGSVCSGPIPITSLSYQVSDNTGNYGDEVDTVQGNLCGATPAATNYLAGNEVFYSYTPAANGIISVTMTPTAASPNSSVFVYDGCANIGLNCVAGLANAGTTVRSLPNINVLAGHTYIIVISSSATTQSIGYTLLVQSEDCTPKPTNLGAPAVTIGLTSATLTWDAGTFSSWQVAVQPLGGLVPTGPGVPVSTNSYTPNTLTAATQYQFWVRAECGVGSGIFSAWAGPFAFNTKICDPATTCIHTFRMTDTGNNGWQGARMQIRQNGILVDTIGSTFTAGGGPVNVDVPMCPDVPFDLFWSIAGTAPQQCKVEIINSFGQTIYTKPAGTGTVGTVLYGGPTTKVKCDAPQCDIAPINVTIAAASITTTGFTITWSAPATTSWDIYIVPAGSPVPGVGTVPTYNDITVADPANPSFTTTIPLLPDTAYDVYVRVNCEPFPSLWSSPVATATTLPTCFKPTGLGVANITTTSAEFSWTNGAPTDTSWEILLVPGPDLPAVLPGSGTIYPTSAGSPLTINGLLPAQIYYYYIRTVCPGDDKSVWAGPIKFNTITCADADKCAYKFFLTNTSGNTWNGGRMQVRQNGILIATLGTGSINNAAGVVVNLCTGVPFDLYWSIAGTVPENIGISIQNPFLDVLFTKAPGAGAPLTVLYSALTNCTPAPCSKPTGMNVTNIGAHQATLNWTDNSTPPSGLFDIYVVLTGGPAPINDPATAPTFSGVPSGYVLSTLNSLPLIPSTSYTFYVRAVCGVGVTSTWTVLTPTSFVTRPENDECITAVPVTVNTGQDCIPINTVSGSTYGSTASLPILDPVLTGTGCGPTNNDVWFSFVAAHTTQTINLTNIVPTPSTAKLNYSVFSGTCDALTKVSCYTSVNGVITGLTVNQTYFIRVYTSAVAGQSAKFDLCITSPPVNDECFNAIPVPVNPNWSCNPALNVPGNTLGASSSAPALVGAGCGTSDDDVWFKFTATNNIHIINLNSIVGTPAAATLNHTVFSGGCDALVKLYCSTATESVALGLIVNQVYYIRVYTSANTAGQFATFNVCVSTPPPPDINNECAMAKTAFVNANSKCTVTTTGNLIGATASTQGGTTCTGTEDDDVWFKFVALSPQHIITLQNIIGTTTNLNHAVYSGTCEGLVLKYCAGADTLTSTATNFVPNQTYYIRVWSYGATSQVVTFDLCIKSVSTCQNAEPFCGSSPTQPFIFENTTGVTPGSGQIACLTTTPNPAYYTLQVGQTGPLLFDIIQNTAFDSAGNPSGTPLDVDYVAWGPFSSPESCNQIVFADCPTCPNNTTNPNFYPFGNIVDCSWSADTTETLSIPNAQAGQYYVILVTNFSGSTFGPGNPGFIKLVQTNYSAPNAGVTICCQVKLGPDISMCAESVTLNALLANDPAAPIPDTYKWYFNNGLIEGATQSTYQATQSGLYKVVATCGINPVYDEIQVLLGPVTQPTTPPDYVICDDIIDDGITSNDGMATFNLQQLAGQLGIADLTPYNITYHLTSQAANDDAVGIDVSVSTDYASQIIYIRIESTILASCYAVVPVNLVVTPMANASFEYGSVSYCKDGVNPFPAFINGGSAGVFSSSSNLLSVNAVTGEINLSASSAGTYTVFNTFAASGGCSGVSKEFTVTISAPLVSDFSYGGDQFCRLPGFLSPTFQNGGVGGVFTQPSGLSIDPATGIINLGASMPGDYIIQNTVGSSGACSGETSDPVTITITEPASGSFSYSSQAYCKSAGSVLPLPVSLSAGGVYLASPSVGLSLDATTGEINLGSSTAGDYTVVYQVGAFGGCPVFTTPVVSVKIIPEFAVSFHGGCESNAYVITALPLAGSFDPATSSYEWISGSATFVVPDALHPERAVLTSPGTVSVKVTTIDGCSSQLDIPSVDYIKCELQKGISPDHNGQNDSFDLTGYNVKHLSIYNRYGTEVYQFDNYTNQWIGQSNSGDELPDGTYFYVIERVGSPSESGWIYINR